MKTLLGATALAAMGMHSMPAAQCQWQSDQALVPSAGYGTTPHYFGRSHSVSGDLVLIGAPGLEEAAGEAFLFARSGEDWIEEAVISAGDSTPENDFGRDVSLRGLRALVGAPGALQGAGAAYVFEHQDGAWVEVAQLGHDDPEGTPEFGRSVVLGDGVAFVGAPDSDLVYVFEEVAGQWSQAQLLQPSVPSDHFGFDLSLDGDLLAVGAPEGNHAFLFRKGPSGWTEETYFYLPIPEADFGHAVSVVDDVLMVGAPGTASESGEVHVYGFYATEWVLRQIVRPSVAAIQAEFGMAISHSSTTALIGAPADGEGLGSAFVLELFDGDWVETSKLEPELGEVDEYNFGTSVSVQGEEVMVNVGLDQAGVLGIAYAGSLYVWSTSAATCPDLHGYPNWVSLAQGGSQSLAIEVDPSLAFHPYLVLGTMSGTEPGIPLNVGVLPINFDAYSALTMATANSGPFVATFGLLDGQGTAGGAISIAPGLPAVLSGLVLHHSFVVVDPATSEFVHVGNAVRMDLLP